MRKSILLAILAGLCAVLGAQASPSLLKFVWAESQPPVIASPTELSFHDPVFNTDIVLTALNGATFTAHAFDASFPSLPSPLGPLGTGKEDFSVHFASGLSIADILVTANVPVLNSAGDIIDAEVVDGATRIGTEEKTATGVSFTEQLNQADSLDFSLTNFLFAPVPEPSTYLMAALAIGACALFYRKRLFAR
jgi:PEP-CTERM motif-containing protein